MLLRMEAAMFTRGRECLLEPTTVSLDDGGYVQHRCATQTEARVLARVAAGIVKCTSGRVFIADYDPRIQPVQVKRLVGFIPQPAPSNPFDSPQAYFAYRADLWGLSCRQTVERCMEMLNDLGARFTINDALAIVGALMTRPRLLIAENRHADFAEQLRELAPSVALFATDAPAASVHTLDRMLL